MLYKYESKQDTLLCPEGVQNRGIPLYIFFTHTHQASVKAQWLGNQTLAVSKGLVPVTTSRLRCSVAEVDLVFKQPFTN